MVAFGDPRLADPMSASCAVPGRGRWVDTRTWVHDFERDLPGGLNCRFTQRDDLRALDGTAIGGRREFAFSTGGPAIIAVDPRAGSEDISEDQVFVLALDAQTTTASVLANAYCAATGVNERIPLRIVSGSLRAAILARSEPSAIDRNEDAGDRSEAPPDARLQSNRLLVRCTRTLPGDSEIRLVWGKGIRTPAGVASEDDQTLVFRTRPEFRARFTCTRMNQSAQCIPVLPMRLQFSAPISPAMASAVRLRGSDGRLYRASPDGEAAAVSPGAASTAAAEAGLVARLGQWWAALTRWLRPNWHAASVEWVEFKGPFPEKATFSIELPSRLRDDAGRLLANAASFPLEVRTDEDPPLIKFAARFGVIEANAGALLPVTVRNIDADVSATSSSSPDTVQGTEGRLLRVDNPSPRELVTWMERANEGGAGDGAEPGQRSILRSAPGARALVLPRTTGPREFEVIGIPLGEPGFYVVEFASRRLGAALLDTEQAKAQRDALDRAVSAGKPVPVFPPAAPSRDPYFVPATALVTNLVAHFKRGREGSLVWVTSLDRGEPVEGARVRVLDCDGTVYHDAVTDRDGIVRVDRMLPAPEQLPGCASRHDRQLMVTASRERDFTFTLANWDNGIAPWRFNLPTGEYEGPYSIHAVLARSLVRAGETVHMKLFARERRRSGFSVPPVGLLESRLVIEHVGSEQKYEVPTQWQNNGNALAQWAVPADAKLGTYLIRSFDQMPRAGSDFGREVGSRGEIRGETRGETRADSRSDTRSRTNERVIGEFRVEEFRLPTMRATIKPPAEPLIAAGETSVDVQLAYLSGGPAGGAAVRLRTAATSRAVSFPRHEGFVFANGDVLEGVIGSRVDSSRLDEYEDATPEGRSAGASEPDAGGLQVASMQSARLDASGGARLRVSGLPASTLPQDLLFELEYRDANGETLTSTARAAWWPAAVVVGLRAENWAVSRDRVKMAALVVDPAGRPLAGVQVTVDLLKRQTYSHRRRLLGGFYAFESYTDVSRIGALCSGRTDAGGRLECEARAPAAGNLILRARAVDAAGRASVANREVWIAGKEEWWFDPQDSDRMDVLAEQPRYEPGQTARFQVRMPFRSAKALVTLEREGVIEGFVRTLSGTSPVIEVPVTPRFAPNMFVSVLAVRGRVSDVQPTATVDLGKPAYRLGIGEVAVGWRAHELKVEVKPERASYRVRETARVALKVLRADGSVPPVGTEIALAAVDEALLELAPNETWALLRQMMGRRGLEVFTATAQMHVVGRRHFGKKAVLPGGGGGRQSARELFDTLLAWRGQVVLDANGEASVEVPLNDSLSSFRIVAIASGAEPGNAGLFGTGSTTIVTTQDLMLLSALPALAREGDRFDAQVTVRNASDRPQQVTLSATVTAEPLAPALPLPAQSLAPQAVTLAPGEAKQVRWPFTVPVGVERLRWELAASVSASASLTASTDRLRIVQRIVPAVPVRTLQATIVQVEAAGSEPTTIPVQRPADALADRGAIEVSLARSLAGELRGVREYMQQYPYTCLEQQSSRAIALGDRAAWDRLMAALPAYLDRDGLARFFPVMREGSDVLTSHLLAIAHEAGWPVPKPALESMTRALERFVQGRLNRASDLPVADLVLRRLAALDALARSGVAIDPSWLESISIEPQLWPTSALLDWQSLLARTPKLPQREARLDEVGRLLRARLSVQGSVMGLSDAKTDRLWWLMISGDVNTNRLLLAVMDDPRWRDDLPRMARGALVRQQRGRWDTTVANAWGVLAMAKFGSRFESQPVSGSTTVSTTSGVTPTPGVAPAAGAGTRTVDWAAAAADGSRQVSLAWPGDGEGAGKGASKDTGPRTLILRHEGTGRPWATVSSRAAVPLRERLDAGYRIERTVSAVEQKVPGRWSVGDLMRVRLSIEAQTDMTWVVVSDPVPAGSTILGSGLGGQSSLAASAASAAIRLDTQSRAILVFEERSFEGWRGYWRLVPKGRFAAEYVVRLNQSGRFELPTTRVEAMYAPDVFGELPNAAVEVQQ